MQLPCPFVLAAVGPGRGLLFLLTLALSAGCRDGSGPGGAQSDIPPPAAQLQREFFALEAERRRLDETVWAAELLAQKHEQVFIELWDKLRTQRNPFGVLGNFAFSELILPAVAESEARLHQIQLTRFSGAGQRWTRAEWRAWLEELEQDGYQLEQTEWRHAEFHPHPESEAVSHLVMTLHAVRPGTRERFILRGTLRVTWTSESSSRTGPLDEALPFPERIEVTELELLERQGPPLFEKAISQRVVPYEETVFIDPLIVYDLDANGLSDVILLCRNLVYRNRGQGEFQPDKLCDYFVPGINTGIIADFDGDGRADLLCADLEGLLFYAGDEQGRFRSPPKVIRFTDAALHNPFVMTAGDVNGDGHLDVWLGQYKLPYLEGQMPTPYYDANDGFPAFLLINDGQANFTEATQAAGLAPKRFRRTYSASFADLNGNGHLDFVVVSDFAGVDVYLNNGRGQFEDVTAARVDNPHSFGMAHSFGDYNRDGWLDLLVIGMNSYVGKRLHHLGLGPPELAGHQRKRPDMAYGNRLYFGSGTQFTQTGMSGQIARSGWSWGATSFDFGNNGHQDVYIVNGHKSRESVRDYESQFWRHDIYAATSEHHPALDLYFRATGTRLYGAGFSYGGYEKNRFYLNESGQSFLEAAYLLGLAVERDCRNLVSEDLDGDGNLDLVLTVFEEWPRPVQEFQIYRNRLESPGNWIGFRLREHGRGFSPVGAKVILETSEGTQSRHLVTGDSYRSQHAPTAHFGLGTLKEVERAEIRWPNGVSSIFEKPGINRYHDAPPP